MGLFSILGDVASATIKLAATPITATVDVVKIATGSEPDSTKELIKSAGKDLEDAVDELTGEKF